MTANTRGEEEQKNARKANRSEATDTDHHVLDSLSTGHGVLKKYSRRRVCLISDKIWVQWYQSQSYCIPAIGQSRNFKMETEKTKLKKGKKKD